MIDTAGEVSMDSSFAQVTAEYRRFKKIAPIEAPPAYTKTEDDLNKFQDFLDGRVSLTRSRNPSSSSLASSSSSLPTPTNFQERVNKQEREKVERELKAMATCMQMTDSMNFTVNGFVAPGSDIYKVLYDEAKRHQRRVTKWHKYSPNRGEHPIPTKKLRKLHVSLFESILAHHKFGTLCQPKWFLDHLSETEAYLVGRETFANHENMLFTALSFWVVRSLYYKLYVVFLVDTDSTKDVPDHYYIDYLYVRFCRPIDEK